MAVSGYHNDFMGSIAFFGYILGMLGPINVYFAPRLLRAQPERTGRISSSPSLLAAYETQLCRAARAPCWAKSVAVAGAKYMLTGPSQPRAASRLRLLYLSVRLPHFS